MSNEIVLWTTIANDFHIYLSQALVSLNMIITCKKINKMVHIHDIQCVSCTL